MQLHRSMGWSRTAIVLFGCAVAWVMGVRAPRAGSFDEVVFAGKGRTTLVIEELGVGDDPAEEEEEPLTEVFAKMTFGTEISVFSKGLYARSTFTLPRTGEHAVLVVDVDRNNGAKDWKAGDRGMRARLYTIPTGEQVRFDGDAVSGSLELEAAIVGRSAAGFRIRGWLELRDPGGDGVRDTDDDRAFEVDVTLESVPSPEEIDGRAPPPPRRPQSGFCEIPWCWTDDGYYDGYNYGYGCGEAEVGYDTTSDGCEGEAVDVDPGFEDDGTTAQPGTDEVVSDGCAESDSSSYDDSGCEGSDDGSASDGCDGGDSGDTTSGCDDSSSSSGCSDSGSSSGCESSGCEGDTLEREPDHDRIEPAGSINKAGVDLVGLGLFGASIVTWIAGVRRRRKPRSL